MKGAGDEKVLGAIVSAPAPGGKTSYWAPPSPEEALAPSPRWWNELSKEEREQDTWNVIGTLLFLPVPFPVGEILCLVLFLISITLLSVSFEVLLGWFIGALDLSSNIPITHLLIMS